MKPLILGFVAVLASASAAEPSRDVAGSCLLGYSLSPHIHVREYKTNEIITEDDYADGYDARFFLQVSGKDIGYAEKGEQFGLIYAGKVYQGTDAKPILGTPGDPAPFEPELASWGEVRDRGRKYLCVSFNFSGLGQSGSFQKVRGGYLMPLPPTGSKNSLFFFIANTDEFRKK
jgi:hypothetical protein